MGDKKKPYVKTGDPLASIASEQPRTFKVIADVDANPGQLLSGQSITVSPWGTEFWLVDIPGTRHAHPCVVSKSDVARWVDLGKISYDPPTQAKI